MMMIRKIFVLLLFLPFACNINAQDDDFGLWFTLNTEYGIFKKIALKVNGSLRTFNNTSQVDQTFLEAGMEYKFAKNFSVEGFYRLINTIEDDGNYYYRHRLHFDFNASLPLNKLSFFARIRLQRVTKTFIENDNDLLPVYGGRLKLGAEYLMAGPPLKPYVYFETFTPLYPDPGSMVEKYRLSAGTVLKVTQRISIDAAYIFQRDFEPEDISKHIISMEFNLKF